MKRLIAGAMAAMMLGTTSVALADNHTAAQTTTQITTQTQTGTGTTATTTNTQTETTTNTQTETTTNTQTETTTNTNTEVQLPAVTINPDSLLYRVKLLIEQLRLAITLDAAAKAQLLVQQAELRLAEANAMLAESKTDLAAQALAESQLKFQAAQTVMSNAAESGKDLTEVQKSLSADEAKIRTALALMIASAPDAMKAQVEAAATEVAVQMAAAKDQAAKDEKLLEEAKKALEQAQAEGDVKAQMEAMPPRIALVLSAMASTSGKSLTEVVALYNQHKGLGLIAQKLGVKMRVVQHAAQVEFKALKKGNKAKVEAEEADGTEAEAEVEATGEAKVTAPGFVDDATATGDAKVEIKGKGAKKHQKAHKDADDEDGDEDDSKGAGKGAGKGRGKGLGKGNGKAEIKLDLKSEKGASVIGNLGVKAGGQ